MKLGIGASDVSIVDLIELANQNEVSGILTRKQQLGSLSPSELRELVDLNDLEICQWGSWDYNPLLPTPQTLQTALEDIAIAKEIGSHTVVMPGGSFNQEHPFCAHPDNFDDRAIAEAASSLQPVAEVAEEKEVVVALEFHFATVMKDWAACKHLLEQIGSAWIQLEFDAGNMVQLENYWNTRALLHQGFDLVGNSIATCHVKDIVLRNQLHFHMDDCPAGEGCIDWVELIKLVGERLHPDTYLIIEHTPVDKIAGTVDYMRTCAEKAGATIQG